MRLAVVTQTYPKGRCCDVVFTDTWQPMARVRVMSGTVGSDMGGWDIPSVKKPDFAANVAAPSQTGRQLIALVDQANNRPIIVGFLPPEGGQMEFTQDDRSVHRHLSGAYTTTAPDGSMELFHPSGSYFRIGTGAHEDLTPISVESAWKETATAEQPTITLHTDKVNLTITPDGNITLTTEGTAAISIKGNTTVATEGTLGITSQQAMTIHSDASVTITAPSVSINP